MAYDDNGFIQPKPKISAEITFSTDLVASILNEYVRKNYGHDVESIDFVIDSGYEDRMTYRPPGLKHAVLKVKL